MKELAFEVLKRILAAISEERFDDIAGIADMCALNEAQTADFVRRAIGSNGFKQIGEFKAENILYAGGGRGSSFDVVYAAFGLVIRLSVINDGGDSIRTVLNLSRTQPGSVVLLDDTDEYDAVWNRVYGELGFKPGMRESVPFALRKPHAVFGLENMTEEDIDKYAAMCSKLFAKVSKGRVYALDWQHSALLFDPRDPDGRRDFWTVNIKYEGGGYNVYFPSFYPDGDFFFHIDESFGFGLLGHPWRREVWVFGELFLTEFGGIYEKLGMTLKEIDNGQSISKTDH